MDILEYWLFWIVTQFQRLLKKKNKKVQLRILVREPQLK